MLVTSILCNLQDFLNDPRIVDKMFIFRENANKLWSFIDKYPGLQLCMQTLFFFNNMHIL